MAFATNSAMAFVAIVFCFVLRYFLKRANKAADLRDELAAEADENSKVRYIL